MLNEVNVFYVLTILVISITVYQILCIILPPPNFPKNIPTVPFYISFLGTYTNLDQGQIYELFLKEKLEKYGAVKIYFASRWNILVSKPEYLVDIFRNEHIYTKSGNQEKIPSSVLAQYTGENIISAHGENWKKFRSAIGSSIQNPDITHVHENSQKLIDLITKKIEQSGKTIAVTDLLQRYCLQNVGQSILGVNLNVLNDCDSKFIKNIKYLKSQIFSPFYLNFPIFDSLPIPSRLKAKKEVNLFRESFIELLMMNRDDNPNNATNKLIEAHENGAITTKQLMDNAIILMVAGHENPLLLMLSLLYVLSKNIEVQDQLRTELSKTDDPMSCPLLMSTIYETLRLFPPLGQIINRKTIQAVKLDNISIPKAVYVGYNNFATGRQSHWGKDAYDFKPSRWGNTIEQISQKYSEAKRSATLPAFHGRKRACLGEKFALFETKTFLIAIVSSFRITPSASWKEKLTPAGPVAPSMLQVDFEVIEK